jgi:hypothetical protein
MDPELELVAVFVVWWEGGWLVVLRVVKAVLEKSSNIECDKVVGAIHGYGFGDIEEEWLGELWNVDTPVFDLIVKLDIKAIESSVNHSRKLLQNESSTVLHEEVIEEVDSILPFLLLDLEGHEVKSDAVLLNELPVNFVLDISLGIELKTEKAKFNRFKGNWDESTEELKSSVDFNGQVHVLEAHLQKAIWLGVLEVEFLSLNIESSEVKTVDIVTKEEAVVVHVKVESEVAQGRVEQELSNSVEGVLHSNWLDVDVKSTWGSGSGFNSG